MTFSALIVDDHAGMRARIRELVNEIIPGAVFGAAQNAQDACDIVRAVSWKLALVDLQLPDRSGLAVIHAIIATRAATRILAMSELAPETYEPLAMKAGAHAFIHKEHITTRLPALLRDRARWW